MNLSRAKKEIPVGSTWVHVLFGGVLLMVLDVYKGGDEEHLLVDVVCLSSGLKTTLVLNYFDERFIKMEIK